jgi:hypothetical protein
MNGDVVEHDRRPITASLRTWATQAVKSLARVVLTRALVSGNRERGEDALKSELVGDSAGTHLTYLKTLLDRQGVQARTLSVNLDPVAVEKIRARGLEAIQCRAEALFQFAGWRLVASDTYVQYPRRGVLSLARFVLRTYTFEGFYGVILERDPQRADQYLSWQHA